MSAPRVTVFTRSYPPAYLAGGPARSVHALVETLGSEFRFSVVASAVDERGGAPMKSVRPGMWCTFGRAEVRYELWRRLPTRRTIRLLRQTRPDLVYLNSLLDVRFSILPLLLTRVMAGRPAVLLAPRGELSAGALGLKRGKKRLFLAAFRLLRLHKAVTWQASTSQEQAEIQRAFGPGVRVHVAIDLRTDLPCRENGGRPAAAGPGGCSLVFFSRIVPKKNLATVLEAVARLDGRARLSIAGPIEDAGYWAECTALIDGLGDPDLARYVGPVPPDQAVSFLGRFDLFVLPTQGENFGHVVLEALAAGTPVIVGRDTPWGRAEAAGAGWLCDPARPEDLATLIRRFLDLDGPARARMRQAARRVAAEVMDDPAGLAANRAMFRALTRGASR